MIKKGDGLFVLLFILICLTWGSSFILMKKGLEVFSWGQVSALRLAFAGFAILPISIWYLKGLSLQTYFNIVLTGVIGNGIPAFLYTKAETVISSGTAGVLNGMTPLFTLLIGIVFFGLVWKKKDLTGVLIGLLGAVLLILAKGNDINLLENVQYSLLVVVATLLYGLNNNLIPTLLKGEKALKITSISLSTLAFPAMIYLLSTDMVQIVKTNPNAKESLVYVSILGVLGTSLAILLYYKLIQLRGPVLAATVAYVIPIVALMWGFVANEPIGIQHLAGLFLILIGVHLVGRKPSLEK